MDDAAGTAGTVLIIDDSEIVALTFAIVVINSWNRLAQTFRPVVGSYQPQAVTA